MTRLDELIELGDLDELTREVDRLCDRKAWDGLLALRDRCRAALERGKQLWPVAAHAEYRLALQAPGPWAAAVLVPGTGRFALGPLPEVAASSHPWADLAPHVTAGPVSAICAHERVVRGEDLRAAPVEQVLELPLALQPWEPAYPVAEYHPDRAAFPTPPGVPLEPVTVPSRVHARRTDDVESCRALADLAAAWVTESNGRAGAVAVQGDHLSAIAALGIRGARVAEIPAEAALAWMAWTAASGGAHGRRRGMAAGRFAAWWAAAAVAGVVADWPLPADELGEACGELRWFLWDAGEPATGWVLRLAVADPAEGLAWALSATDARL